MSERRAGDELTLAKDEVSSADTGVGDETLAGEPDEPDEPDAARRAGAGTRPRADLPPPRLGHYVLLDRLGQGGMGAVYAAYDTKLDRKVAIKILHAHGGEQAQARLVREAQALARLSHPNVVQIYEIAQLDAQACLVMEFVDGSTLREWLRSAPRSRSAILAVFDAAGRGLAAAHRQGLVHRDFKPDNVMIRHDERVLVMDFGLARGEASGEPAARVDTSAHAALRSNQLSSELTRTGALMGTPAYMAPEQFVGGEVGVLADQFAFCVALWEALGGRRPFVGDTLGALMLAITTGELAEPTTSIPSWLRRVLTRGLAIDPQQRWPSLEALLDALRRDPTRRRRGLALTLATLGLLGAATLGWTLQRSHAREQALAACELEAGRLRAELGPETRAAVGEAFRRAAPEQAASALEHGLRLLDAYADEWATLRRQTCVELELDHTLAPARAAPMLECLDERRDAFLATLEAWRAPSRQAVASAVPRAAMLEPLSTCRDDAWLAHRVAPPEDPATREAIAALQQRKRSIDALKINFEHEAAAVEARALLRDAEALGWLPMIARARELIGDLEYALGHYELAAEIYAQTYLEAGRAGDDVLVIVTALSLGDVIGFKLGRPREGLAWLAFAEMMIARLGLEGTRLDGARLSELGIVQDELGEYELALATHTRKRELDLVLYGPRSATLATTLNNRATTLFALGRDAEAEADLELALDIRRELFGPHHTHVAIVLDNLAIARYNRDDFAGARALVAEGLAIWESVLGPDHPDVATSLANLGTIEWHLGHNDAALQAAARSLDIRERTLGREHPELAVSLANLASVQMTIGRHDEALANHRRAIELRERALGPEHPRLADALVQLGSSLNELGRHDEAIPHFERALAIHVAKLGPRHPSVAEDRVGLAAALLGLERASEALEQLDAVDEILADPSNGRALTNAELLLRAEVLLALERTDAAAAAFERVLEQLAREPDLARELRARFGLARARLAAGQREAALEQARIASTLVDTPGFVGAEARRGELDAWLAEHE